MCSRRMAAWLLPASEGQAAVDADRLTGHLRCGVGDQEDGHGGYLDRRWRPTEREALHHLGDQVAFEALGAATRRSQVGVPSARATAMLLTRIRRRLNSLASTFVMMMTLAPMAPSTDSPGVAYRPASVVNRTTDPPFSRNAGSAACTGKMRGIRRFWNSVSICCGVMLGEWRRPGRSLGPRADQDVEPAGQRPGGVDRGRRVLI